MREKIQVITYLLKGIFCRILACLFVLGCLFPSYSDSSGIIKVDFDDSMGIEERGRYNLLLKDGKRSEKYLNFYKNIFKVNFSSEVDYTKPVKIPKIIHHIWVGPKPVPELYEKYASTCKALNPDFEYKLWTNRDVEEILNISPKHKELYKAYEKVRLYAGQKDVLEYMILYKYGGVYMDMDFECKKSLRPLHHQYDFYSGLEAPVRWGRVALLSAAVVGSSKENKIFLDTLDKSVKNYNKLYKDLNTPTKVFLRSLRSKDGIKIPHSKRTLMFSLGETLVESGKSYYDRPIVFPATYFNPVMKPVRYFMSDYVKHLLGVYKNKGKAFNSVKPETIAVQDFYDD